jgi:uncharacterized protein YlxW (UPF0749 family)
LIDFNYFSILFFVFFCFCVKKQLNEKLINDLEKQTNSSRNQIELLNNEITQLEKTLNELKEEKNQLIQTKMDGDQDDQRQNLVRQITLEKVKNNLFLFNIFFVFFSRINMNNK